MERADSTGMNIHGTTVKITATDLPKLPAGTIATATPSGVSPNGQAAYEVNGWIVNDTDFEVVA